MVAVLLAVIGAYYYLRIVKLAYFDAPETEDEIIVKGESRIVLVTNVAIIVLILPWIGSLINLCNQVISRLAL